MSIRLVPEVEILIEGQKLDDETISKIISVRVSYTLEKSDMFKLIFKDDDFKLQNSKKFEVGKEITVKLGYDQNFEKMIEGEIVQMHHSYETHAPSSLTVVGFDKMFRLNRTKNSRSFIKMTDSQIAKQIASEMGLQSDIDSTSQKHDYVFQNNQSNLNFLKQRAKRIDYEVEVSEKKLLFKKAQHEKRAKSVDLVWDRTLIEFHPKVDATKIVDEIEVTGWDPKTKKLIKGKAKAGDEKKSIKGESGSSSVKGKFKSSNSKSFKVDTPITSQEEADTIAKARLNQMNMEYITGHGIAVGEPALNVGKLINIDGIGDMLNGEYYIVACEHIFTVQGYKTSFDVKRGVHQTNSKKKIDDASHNMVNRNLNMNESDTENEEENKKHWIEFIPENGNWEYLIGKKYKVTLPTGEIKKGTINGKGMRFDGVSSSGESKIEIFDKD